MREDQDPQGTQADTNRNSSPAPNLLEPQTTQLPISDPNPSAITDKMEDAPGHQNLTQYQISNPQTPPRKQMSVSDRWIVGLTAIIAGTSMIGAVIFYLQLCAMQGQLDEMRRGAADTQILAKSAQKQADNTEKLANAAIEQVRQLEISVRATQALADATRRTADETSKLVSLSQDPIIHVSPQGNSLALTEDSSGKYPVFLTNSGHTAVKEVRVHYSRKALEIVESPNNFLMHKSVAITDERSIKTIDPGQTVPYTFDFNNEHIRKDNFKFDPHRARQEFFM